MPTGHLPSMNSSEPGDVRAELENMQSRESTSEGALYPSPSKTSRSDASTTHDAGTVTGRSISPLTPRASGTRASDWQLALFGGNDALLTELADSEPPGVALFEMETHVNGVYRSHDLRMRVGLRENESLLERLIGVRITGAKADGLEGSESALRRARARANSLSPYIERIRCRLGENVREFDLRLLRLMRRSSALSPVLGAGVSMAHGCGAPSWAALVQELLEITLERGLQVSHPQKDDLAKWPHHLQMFLHKEGFTSEAPAGQNAKPSDQPLHTRRSTHETLEFQQKTINEYSEEERKTALEIVGAIKAGIADNELLMSGADLAFKLCGQHLFRLITQLLYEHNRQPSVIHQQIARLAHAQWVPDRRQPAYLPGWDSIVTYNFDNFMSTALEQEGVPSAAWAMRGDQLAGDPNPMAIQLGQVPWLQSVLHLHGYTPRKLYKITNVRFVFAACQYRDTYQQQTAEVFRKFVEEYLENPVHICLYIGCSFTDVYMNQLLEKAFQKWPGRYHYALLERPGKSSDRQTQKGKQREAEETYSKMGIRPIWFDDFSELPHIIARLE
ncbi:hypothetical protein Q7P37_001524 [Cladosporium fusiforme]